MNKIIIESIGELDELYEKDNKILTDQALSDDDDTIELYSSKIAEIGEHLENYGFIFNEFRLIVNKYLSYKVVVDHDNFNITLRKNDKYGLLKSVHTYNVNYYDYATSKTIYLFNKFGHKSYTSNYKQLDESTVKDLTILIEAIDVIVYYSIHSEISLKDVSVKNNNRQSSKVKTTKTSNTTTVYKLTDVIRKYSKQISSHQNHVITCEHWNVRGHYRHYKNGKVIWIPEYEKGKNREAKIQTKTYKI